MKSSCDRASKKPYYSPNLRIYGEIRELTQAFNASSTDFDNANGNNKTNAIPGP